MIQKPKEASLYIQVHIYIYILQYWAQFNSRYVSATVQHAETPIESEYLLRHNVPIITNTSNTNIAEAMGSMFTGYADHIITTLRNLITRVIS